MSYCFLCYSADNMLYNTLCNRCSESSESNEYNKYKIINTCDVCGLPCNDKCIEVFATCLSISDCRPNTTRVSSP